MTTPVCCQGGQCPQHEQQAQEDQRDIPFRWFGRESRHTARD